MLYFNEATLIYAGQVQQENGSPVEVTISRTAKVKEVKTFSLNYYLMGGDNQRLMRKSKNIVVPRWMTDDFAVDGVRYELLYVDYNGVRYRVKNLLKYYQMEQTRSILDLEELR